MFPTAPTPAPSIGWPDVPEECLSTLPPVLRAVVKALGFARAQYWLQLYGGVPVAMPRYKQSWMGLAACEIDRLRETLDNHMDATGRVILPKGDKLFVRFRDQAIRYDRGRGWAYRALAYRYHLTSRHIINVCHGIDDGGQYELF